MKNENNKKRPKKRVTRNPSINTLNLVKMMNEQDQKVAEHVGKKNVEIAQAIDFCVSAINKKGRVIYVGAGTPGKLAFLDASEIYPTYESKN
jgi:N-acetylmuramic acid 6-phosphate etherase